MNMPEISVEAMKGLLGLYGLKVIYAFAIFFIGRRVVGMGVGFLDKVMSRAHFDTTLSSFIGHVLHAVGLVIVIVAVLGQLGVETTSIVAMLGAAGLAVGLALQGSLSNLAAGIVIIIFRPFRVGHYIEVAGTGGTVEEVDILTTTLRTNDNKTVIVPNSKITGDNIINYSAQATRRIDLAFTVSLGEDLNKVKDILRAAIQEDSRVLGTPAPEIAVSDVTDAGVTMVFRPWVKSEDYWPARYAMVERIKALFDDHGIRIPQKPTAPAPALKAASAAPKEA